MSDTTPTIQPHPLVEQAVHYWHGMRGDRSMPERRDFDPTDVPKLLPHIILLDVTHDPLDFKFRLIGTYVDRLSNGAYTGRYLRDLHKKGPGSPVWMSFSKVAESGLPHLGYLDYIGPDDNIAGVEKAILPLGTDGTVTMLLSVLVFIRQRGAHKSSDKNFRASWPRGPVESEYLPITIDETGISFLPDAASA